MGKMTPQELRQLASLLANSAHVRYWLHWNYPDSSHKIMAVQIADWSTWDDSQESLQPMKLEHEDLERKGFAWEPGEKVYLIEREED